MYSDICCWFYRTCGPIFFLGLLLFSLSAHAMSVTPLSLELSAGAPGNKSTLRVNNDGAAPIPVEIQIARVTLNEKGETQSEPASGQFLVFPPQAIIPAGTSQAFRVQWLGDPKLQQSQTFIFSVNQLPVDLGASKSGVQIVFNFSVIVNVAPLTGQTLLKLVGASVLADEKGEKRAVLTIMNSGNRHALMGDGSITLSDGAWSKTITGGELRQMIGLGLVQPGKTRRFSLAVKDLPPKIDARIQSAASN